MGYGRYALLEDSKWEKSGLLLHGQQVGDGLSGRREAVAGQFAAVQDASARRAACCCGGQKWGTSNLLLHRKEVGEGQRVVEGGSGRRSFCCTEIDSWIQAVCCWQTAVGNAQCAVVEDGGEG